MTVAFSLRSVIDPGTVCVIHFFFEYIFGCFISQNIFYFFIERQVVKFICTLPVLIQSSLVIQYKPTRSGPVRSFYYLIYMSIRSGLSLILKLFKISVKFRSILVV